MKDYKYAYIMTSERGFSDETECKVWTDAEYRVGEWVERGDGLRWRVDMIVKGPSANLSMIRAAAQALMQSGWTWEAVCGYLRWAKDAGFKFVKKLRKQKAKIKTRLETFCGENKGVY